MQVVKNLNQIPGRVIKSGENKIRITEGGVPSPRSLELEVLHEQPGLCAWVGKKNDKGQVVDAVPVFVAGELGSKLSVTTAGAILLTDLVRDLTVENRLAAGNFAIGNFREMDEHVKATYGSLTEKVLKQEYLNRKLGTKTAQFLAKRFARILKVNYLDGSNLFEQDKSRIKLKSPHKVLTKFESDLKFNNTAELATWLGERWIEMEQTLLLAHPELRDRSRYFSATDDKPEEASAL